MKKSEVTLIHLLLCCKQSSQYTVVVNGLHNGIYDLQLFSLPVLNVNAVKLCVISQFGISKS